MLWLRLVGALVAGSLSAIAGAISDWLNLYWWSPASADLPLVGVGVGLVLGFIAGPRVAHTRHPVPQAVGLTVSAAVLGWAVISVMSLVGAGWRGLGFPSSSVGDVLLFGIIGMPVAVAFALPVTAPVAFAGVAILRISARNPVIGAMAIALSISLAVLGSALADTLSSPQLSSEASAGAVDLQWTVVNRSAGELELGILEHSDDGFGGSITGVEPCFTTTGRDGVGAAWFLTLDPESAEQTPPELASAAQAPGSDVSVWIEIAPDGTNSVEVGREAPSAEQLTADHCWQGGTG